MLATSRFQIHEGGHMYNSCFLFFDLSIIECASWAQAVGSIIALCIAIWIPFQMKKADQRRQRESELAEAHVACATVTTMYSSAIGFLESFIEELNAYRNGGEPPHARTLLKRAQSLGAPTEPHLAALYHADRELALSTVRGFHHLAQIKRVFLMQHSNTNFLEAGQALVALGPLARVASNELKAALERADRFLEDREGPANDGP